jgi:S-adenosylmethionine synthetase
MSFPKLVIPRVNICSMLVLVAYLSAIHEQSADINQGVERKNPEEQGAGDQGMMFGYATNETENYMPLALDIAHKLLGRTSRFEKRE